MRVNVLENKKLIKILKIAMGASLAIIIANILGLEYSTSAGIITLLTIQDTKKETLIVTLKRLISFFVSLLISLILFQSISYHPVIFGVYLLFFIGVCYLFQMEDGIAMSAVLTTHFLVERSMSFYWIRNEILLMLIGISIGIILNLYMPRNLKYIRRDIYEIEVAMKEVLAALSFNLLVEENCDSDEFCSREKEKLNDDCFQLLEIHLDKAQHRAFENMNNTFLTDTRYYIEYIDLRKNQAALLKDIYKKINYLTIVPNQAYLIADIIKDIQISFHEYNNALELLEELNLVKDTFRQDSLPDSREQFENRAILYNILSDLELFLNMKAEFVRALSKEQIDVYWKEEILDDSSK